MNWSLCFLVSKVREHWRYMRDEYRKIFRKVTNDGQLQITEETIQKEKGFKKLLLQELSFMDDSIIKSLKNVRTDIETGEFSQSSEHHEEDAIQTEPNSVLNGQNKSNYDPSELQQSTNHENRDDTETLDCSLSRFPECLDESSEQHQRLSEESNEIQDKEIPIHDDDSDIIELLGNITQKDIDQQDMIYQTIVSKQQVKRKSEEILESSMISKKVKNNLINQAVRLNASEVQPNDLTICPETIVVVDLLLSIKDPTSRAMNLGKIIQTGMGFSNSP